MGPHHLDDPLAGSGQPEQFGAGLAVPRQAGHLGQVGIVVPVSPSGQGPGRSGQQDRQGPLDDAGPALADIAQQQRPLAVGVAGVRAAAEMETDSGGEALRAGHALKQRQFTLREQVGDRAGEVPAGALRIR